MFSVAGKYHVAMKYAHDQIMHDVSKYLREAWYGNADTFDVTDNINKYPVDCCKLWAHYLTITGTEYVPL